MPEQPKRRLAAIMFTDIVGYSALMQADEEEGRRFRQRHKEIFDTCNEHYHGEILQYYGDGTLSIFDSAVSAVECAIALQQQLQANPTIPVRIGIHLGDIHYDDTEVYGHGVNVAARIEPVCNPGGIFISGKVYDEIRNQANLKAEALGSFPFKNIQEPIDLYAVQAEGVVFPSAADLMFIEERSRAVNISQSAVRSGLVKDLPNNQPKFSKKTKTLGIAFLALAIVTLLFFSDFLFSDQQIPPSGDAPISIAVLPFVNLSDSEENEYFSDGMTEDILTLLSKIDNFKVTSRTSVMQYKNTEKSVRDIGEELKVDHLLEGSVRRHGQRVRINAQLIDAATDEHLWAHTYDEEMTDIFRVQSQVAKDITEKLKQNLSPDDERVLTGDPSVKVEAYDLYLKGRERYRTYSSSENDTAIMLFKRALDIDPDYAYAYAGLGDAYGQKGNRYMGDESYLDTAIMYSQRAINLDPTLSEGYKALGLALHYKEDLDRALEHYKKAIALNASNDMAAHNISQIYKQKGNYAEALRWANRTFEINRNVPGSILMLAKMYKEIGMLDMALQLTQNGLTTHPDNNGLKHLEAEILMYQGDYDKAYQKALLIKPKPEIDIGSNNLKGSIAIYQNNWRVAASHYEANLQNDYIKKYPAVELISRTMLAFVRKKINENVDNKDTLQKILDQVTNLQKQVSKSEKVELDLLKTAVYTLLGDNDKATASLDNVCDPICRDHFFLKTHPIAKSLWDHPEFQRIIKKSDQRLEEIRTIAESMQSQVAI